MSAESMKLTLHVWRQPNKDAAGELKTYQAEGVNPHMSFLEMLDVVNEGLVKKGEEPIAVDHDCREGICGMCSMVINGVPHGGHKGVTVCQLHMRHFKDGDAIYIEPWRAKAFPVLRDLVVDRGAFDRIVQAGGFISSRTGGAPDANAVPIPKVEADQAFDAAACIGCGACVAACRNASAMLFVGAKLSHLAHLPQGQPERDQRVLRMVQRMESLDFGSCSNHGECQAVCPKGISIDFIARLNRDCLRASMLEEPTPIRDV